MVVVEEIERTVETEMLVGIDNEVEVVLTEKGIDDYVIQEVVETIKEIEIEDNTVRMAINFLNIGLEINFEKKLNFKKVQKILDGKKMEVKSIAGDDNQPPYSIHK